MDRIDTHSEFKRSVVEPDFREFMVNKADLRKAWHRAGSLFYLHDWVYVAHKASIDRKYMFVDDDRKTKPVSRATDFATSLGQKYSGRRRGFGGCFSSCRRRTGTHPAQVIGRRRWRGCLTWHSLLCTLPNEPWRAARALRSPD